MSPAAGSWNWKRRRLDELRLTCLEERNEAELSLGHHDALLPELERLVEEEPLREKLWGQLVTALYRCQRQADALAAYRRARALLSEELGLEPSEELRELERAVLRHEIARSAPLPDHHNLPAQLSSFIGREQELTELGELLREHRLVTLTGVGGAGKTRLALEVAYTAGRRLDRWDLARGADDVRGRRARAGLLSRERSGSPSGLMFPRSTALLDHLRTEELLLVVDNCEHLAGPCGELAHEVLRSLPPCPRARNEPCSARCPR